MLSTTKTHLRQIQMSFTLILFIFPSQYEVNSRVFTCICHIRDTYMYAKYRNDVKH